MANKGVSALKLANLIHMEQKNYWQIIKNNWYKVAIVTLLLIILSLGLSLVRPLQYRSRVELLVIQKQNLTMDAYAAARASEKLANGLATVVKTKSFFDQVINSNFNIARTHFPYEEKDVRKYWQKNIVTSVSPETSLLRIDVYDTNRTEANKIANAIAYVLVNNSEDFYGGNNDVFIKVVNEPLASNHPVRPAIVINSLTGLVLGLILSGSWLFYQENKNYQKYSPVRANNQLNQNNNINYHNSETVPFAFGLEAKLNKFN